MHQLRAMIDKIVVCGLDKTHFRDFKKNIDCRGCLLYINYVILNSNLNNN